MNSLQDPLVRELQRCESLSMVEDGLGVEERGLESSIELLNNRPAYDSFTGGRNRRSERMREEEVILVLYRSRRRRTTSSNSQYYKLIL